MRSNDNKERIEGYIYSLDDVAPVQNEEVQVTNVNAPLEATVSFDWLDIAATMLGGAVGQVLQIILIMLII